jgi:hypothetical protein
LIWSTTESAFVGGDDELGAVSAMEFGEKVSDVGLGGCFADDERRGDVGISESLGHQREDLSLTSGQRFERGDRVGCRHRRRGELVEEASQ